MQPDRCSISLVIPTHNRADMVERVVDRLLAQEGGPVDREIVLVDSGSTDHTAVTAARLAQRHPGIRTLYSSRPGAAAARNLGLDAARGELIVLLDDDILVRSDFLAHIWSHHCRMPNEILLARIVAPWKGIVDPFQRGLLESQDVNAYNFPDPRNVSAEYFYTGCVAIPRSVLGGTRFDESFTGYGMEDIEFGCRLLGKGARMVFVPEIEVRHEYYPTYAGFIKKRFQTGYSLGQLLLKQPGLRGHFVFPRLCVHYHVPLRLMVRLTRPLARALELLERTCRRTGRLNRLLFAWYRASLRVEMYRGFLEFQAEHSPGPGKAG